MKAKILQAIKQYTADHGYPPTTRELLEMTGLKSTQSIHRYLHQLRDDGLIDFVDGQGRTIVVKED